MNVNIGNYFKKFNHVNSVKRANLSNKSRSNDRVDVVNSLDNTPKISYHITTYINYNLKSDGKAVYDQWH